MKSKWAWLAALAAGILILGLARLRFDAEFLNLLPRRLPVVEGLMLYQERFANARELVVTISSPEPAETEAALEAMVRAWENRPELISRVTWQPPGFEQMDKLIPWAAYLWWNQSPEVFNRLLTRLEGMALTNRLQESRRQLATSFSPGDMARLSYDPLQLLDLPEKPRWGMISEEAPGFSSPDGTFRIVFLEAAPELPGYRECASWLESIREEVSRLRREGSLSARVEVDYTGRPAFLAEIAQGMERDMKASVGCTFLIILVLFYVVHRRWGPLLWLMLALMVILTGTAALGGLVFGTLNVISLGFAAILLGLAVDYGLVLYQETAVQPDASARTIRQTAGPGVVWSSATTAAAFALLSLSSLPGLAQLGALVAMGVGWGACLMLWVYLPLTRPRSRAAVPPMAENATLIGGGPSRAGPPSAAGSVLTLLVTAGVVAAALWMLRQDLPRLDHTANALRPQHSPAYDALARIKAKLQHPDEVWWLLFPGADAQAVADQLQRAKPVLETARQAGWIEDYTLPSFWWPHPQYQAAQRERAPQWRLRQQEVEAAILSLGFNSNALTVPRGMWSYWNQASLQTETLWPPDGPLDWVLDQSGSRQEGSQVGLAFLRPAPPAASWDKIAAQIQSELPDSLLTGWSLLGPSLFELVRIELRTILLPMGLVVVICLALAFRSVGRVCLSLGTILISGGGLLVVMALAGWSWNLMNLMALPLLLGTGIDYSIHVQLALRRQAGNRARMRRTVGRALMLCALTTATGFGSLGLSSNAGLASLGQVCAAGLILTYATAVYLLPVWEAWAIRPERGGRY